MAAAVVVEFLVIVIFYLTADGSQQTVLFARFVLSATAVGTCLTHGWQFALVAAVPKEAHGTGSKGQCEERQKREQEYRHFFFRWVKVNGKTGADCLVLKWMGAYSSRRSMQAPVFLRSSQKAG